MKEKEFISVIKSSLNSEFIGDDCAYLKDLGIVITQDSLAEGVHFKTDYISPFQLGYKSVMVNISDIAASGAEPAYITISLSLPDYIDKNFITDFYEGCKKACSKSIKIVGGDITGADKIYISVCALGKTYGRNISSRSGAQIGQKVIVSGNHGSSGAGLSLLVNNKKSPEKFIKAHLEPEACIEFAKRISSNIKGKYAMTDSSDGLMDALSNIANDSGVLLDIDFDKVPHDKDIEKFENWEDLILFGGEDYQIIATVPESYEGGIKIGEVKKGLGIDLKTDGITKHYSKSDTENRLFNHFE